MRSPEEPRDSSFSTLPTSVPRHLQRRREARGQGRQHDQPGHQCDNRPVEVETHEVRTTGAGRSGHDLEPSDRDVCDQDASYRTRNREQKCLREKGRHDPESASTQCDSHGRLLRPRRGAGQKEIGDVRTGDQQDAEHGDHHRAEKSVHLSAGGGAGGSQESDPDTLVRLWIFTRELGGDGGHFQLSTLTAHTIPESSVHIEGAALPTSARQRILTHRNPEVVVVRKPESFGHHPDDLGRFSIDPDRTTDRAAVPPEVIPPRGIAQYDVRGSTRRVLVLDEDAAEEGTDAETLERVGGDERAQVATRALGVVEIDRTAVDAEEVDERRLTRAEVGEVIQPHGPAQHTMRNARSLYDEDTAGVGHIEAAEVHAVYDAEHERAEPDPERENHDGDERRARHPAQRSEPEPEVIEEGLHPANIAPPIRPCSDQEPSVLPSPAAPGGTHGVAGGRVEAPLPERPIRFRRHGCPAQRYRSHRRCRASPTGVPRPGASASDTCPVAHDGRFEIAHLNRSHMTNAR